MDFSSFQKKLILRTTSLAEYLHILSSHWLLILATTCIGTLALFTVITSRPSLYEAKATLQLNPNEPLVEPGTRPTHVRTDLQNFINDQVSILQSQTVLQTLVAGLGYHRSEEAPPTPESEKKWGRLQRTYREIEQRLESRINDLVQPSSRSPEEVSIQGAVHRFRKRSQVQKQENSFQVRLVVLGGDPQALVRELEAWITAYRKRIEDFTEESAKRFLEERKSYWGTIAGERREALEAFRKRNPEASDTMQRFLQAQVIRQEVFLDGLRNRLAGLSLEGESSGSELLLMGVEKGLAETLRKKKEELELQRVDLLGLYPEASEVIKAHDEKIREVERSIKSVGLPASPATGTDKKRTVADSFQKNVEVATAELEKTQRQVVEIETKMVEHRKLESDLQYAEEKVRSFERSMDWRMEFTEGQKLVQVQVWDKPMASTHPINTFQVLETSYGTLGGLVVGFLFAFLRELFRKTIRFKKDVVEELGLEVIGVIPSR